MKSNLYTLWMQIALQTINYQYKLEFYLEQPTTTEKQIKWLLNDRDTKTYNVLSLYSIKALLILFIYEYTRKVIQRDLLY